MTPLAHPLRRRAARIVPASLLWVALALPHLSAQVAPEPDSAKPNEGEAAAAPADAKEPSAVERFTKAIDAGAGEVVKQLEKVLFFDPFAAVAGKGAPPEKPVEIRDAAITALAVALRFQPQEIADLRLSDYDPSRQMIDIPDDGSDELVRLPVDPAGSTKLAKSLAPLAAWLAVRGNEPGPLFYSAEGESLRPLAIEPTLVREIVTEQRPAVPLIVLWLIFGALVFTLVTKFVNIWGFRHAIDLVRGKYSDPTSSSTTGEVSHFQALSAALSATVGLGNIAGVAIAVGIGGPGAVFWMICAGFFGMSSKFVECTLGQKYRIVDAEGRVSGGAMHYLRRGLAELHLGPVGIVLSVLFALLCIGGSFGGGNMFQANQSWETLSSAIGLIGAENASARAIGASVYGVVLAALVALVIIGGIRRIATTASRIVPLMCVLYVLGSLLIIFFHIEMLPHALADIVRRAFSPTAVTGGAIGALLVGVRRAAFSNEAGVGSAAIAHSAAKTEIPVREGFVSLLEPFIDTILVCTMTGLVIVVTEAHLEPAYRGSENGAEITAQAWRSVAGWFPFVLAIATVLFAFSTLISWSYYGERCWTWLFGPRTALAYRIIFVAFVYIGSVVNLGNVIAFSDMMILGMAFPNVLGCLLLSGKVRSDLFRYWSRVRKGEFQTFK